MKIIKLNKKTCWELFVHFKDDEYERENTLSNVGLPVFDTEKGTVEIIETDHFNGTIPRDELDDTTLEMLHDCGINGYGEPKLTREASNPKARYVMIPALPRNSIKAQRTHVFSREEAFERSVAVAEEKDNRIPGMIVDWLEKIGRARGVRYQYIVVDLNY